MYQCCQSAETHPAQDPARGASKITFESNAIDPATNEKLGADGQDPDLGATPPETLPKPELDLFGHSTLNQLIETEQLSVNSFIARVILEIGSDADTGFIGDEGSDIPNGCAQILEITSVSSRLGFQNDQILVTDFEIGRIRGPEADAFPGVDVIPDASNDKSLPCCTTTTPLDPETDPVFNTGLFWSLLNEDQPISDFNDGGIVDLIARDPKAGTFFTVNFLGERIECYSATFELIDQQSGCNTASVFFADGPVDGLFPQGFQTNVGHLVPGTTAQLQNVGSLSDIPLGIPPNGFFRGDMDFNGLLTFNDIGRSAMVTFGVTDPRNEAEIEVLLGRECAAVCDLSADHSCDLRDLLTLIQLLFAIGGTIRDSDVPKLQADFVPAGVKIEDFEPVQANLADGEIPPLTVPFGSPGYERQVAGGKDDEFAIADPGRFTCKVGLECVVNGL